MIITKHLARVYYKLFWITNCKLSSISCALRRLCLSAYTYIEAAFYASWIFSGLLSSLPHSIYSGGITHRPTTLLVTEIALPRLLMGKGMKGIHRGFIEETVILEKRWDLARLACVKVQHSIAVQRNVSVATRMNFNLFKYYSRHSRHDSISW